MPEISSSRSSGDMSGKAFWTRAPDQYAFQLAAGAESILHSPQPPQSMDMIC